MRLAVILPAWTLVMLPLRAQTSAPKPGSVEGTVFNSASGAPIKKASVRLENQPGPGGTAHNLTTQSDADGHFRFDNVEPGLYAVNARRDAYMDPQGRYWNPAPFRVTEEQRVKDVVLKLVPLGVLSGHVFDEDGDPIPRANVTLLRYYYETGRTRLGSAGQRQTNDLGEFEIINLEPGRYYLQAAGPPIHNLPVHTRWTRQEEAYPITFYPNVRQISEAAATDVAPGAHVSNLDFHLRKGPVYHIRGKVAGKTASQQEIFDQLRVDTPGTRFGAIFQSGLQPDGSFDIPGVANGSYDVSYTHLAIGKSDIPYPVQSVHVADADVNGLVFSERPQVQLSGTIAVEGAQPKKLDLYVALQAGRSASGAGGMSAADGRFQIEAAPMEICHLDLRFPPEGYYVKSIRLGDREIKDGEIDLTAGASGPLNILLASDGAAIEGNVQTADGKPSEGTEITVAPSDEYSGRSDLLKRATTDTAGNFQVKDVAPGDYRVYAWEIDVDQSPRSVEFRKLFDAKSAAVSIGPNAKASVQLNVITADDISRETEHAAMISVWIIVLLAQAVSAPPAPASTSVKGQVVNSLNGDAVAKAVVILRARDPERGLSYADEADAQGHFTISDVEPGEYTLAVERAGFILEFAGAAGAPAPSVNINAGQRIEDLAIRLTPLGVISGRIVDADGEPARGAKADALHYVYTGGKKQLRTVAEVEAGDRGDFRLFGLRPGTYYLKATGLQVAPFELADKGTITYYPEVGDSNRAVPIELRAGAQVRGFDIRLQSSAAYRVRFQTPPGITVSPTQGHLSNSQGFVPTEGWSSRNEMGFGNVPPGSYEAIFIGQETGKSPSYARRHVEVSNADVDGGTLEFVPAPAISGTVRVEGGAISSLAKLSIQLQSDLMQFNASTGVHSDGSFAFEGVAPLIYSLSIERTAGLYLKSLRMSDRPLAQPRLDAGEKLEPLTIVLGADIGELEGAVENSKGDPIGRARVDAIAADRPDWNRSAFSDEKGRFKVSDLPPGRYRIFAWENVPDGAPQDPEFRKPFDRQAFPVSIQPKGHASLKITAISAAQVDRSLQ